jgi:hypothetical protein
MDDCTHFRQWMDPVSPLMHCGVVDGCLVVVAPGLMGRRGRARVTSLARGCEMRSSWVSIYFSWTHGADVCRGLSMVALLLLPLYLLTPYRLRSLLTSVIEPNAGRDDDMGLDLPLAVVQADVNCACLRSPSYVLCTPAFRRLVIPPLLLVISFLTRSWSACSGWTRHCQLSSQHPCHLPTSSLSLSPSACSSFTT